MAMSRQDRSAKSPKAVARRRTLSVPGVALEGVVRHMERYTARHPDALHRNRHALLIVNATGEPISATVLQRAWSKARKKVGRSDLHLHDLRHTGLTLADATGATTAELMHRAGHSSAAAALRYQNATQDRDRILADALGALVRAITLHGEGLETG
jgi:integrase